MPMNVEVLKKLSEDLCFVRGRQSSPLREYLVNYLKENIGKAFTTTELIPTYRKFRDKTMIEYNEQLSNISEDNKVDRRILRKRLIVNDGGQKIMAKIHRSLKAEVDCKNPLIKKKGSYYWYEKK